MIRALRILPPLAFARLGSGTEPLDNYTIEVDEDPNDPLGDYRRIAGARTLVVDENTGEIVKTRTPAPGEMTFKQDGRIRPVAPFLEVFALTGKNTMAPLTLDLLREMGLSPESISWRVVVANRKVVRRTQDPRDLVAAHTKWFSGHEPEHLHGYSKNFVSPSAFVDFGSVRYIKPNADFPEIRLRFTPAKGLIYGPRLPGGKKKDTFDAAGNKEIDPNRVDPNGRELVDPSRAIYDTKKGSWCGYRVTLPKDPSSLGGAPLQNETMPPSLFAILPPAPPWLHNDEAVSRGYFDDACDGFVEVALTLPGGKRLVAEARIASAPPLVVPDSLMVRTLADEFDQIIHGPTVGDEPAAVTRARAEDIIRRAHETVRFLNVEAMNGGTVIDVVDGTRKERQPEELDTMPAEEAFGVERMMRPVFSAKNGTVHTIAALDHHKIAFHWVRKGNAQLLARYFRKPDEVADFTDKGRRKMPALMSGADGSYLALTHRQLDTIRKTGNGADTTALGAVVESPRMTPRNLSAQVHYEAAGNPVSTRPVTSVGNCIPGLELDFRAVWRRLFVGIVLREYDGLVVDTETALPDRKGKKRSLAGHRLLRVAGVPVVTQMRGPSAQYLDENYERSPVCATEKNPYGVAPLEWSNALAHVLHTCQGKKVTCDFTSDVAWYQPQPWDEQHHISVDLLVRPFFEPETSVISKALAGAGELTQGLCSPWQNDFRECSCYYWASARPDFVNIAPAEDGMGTTGDNWLQKERTGRYVPDDYEDPRLILFNDILSQNWEEWFRFQVGGKDVPGDHPKKSGAAMKKQKHPASVNSGRKAAAVSFARDIAPLFTEQDVESMRGRHVLLRDYAFMKAHATLVFARLTGTQTPRMPDGGPYWSRRNLDLFNAWVVGGLKP